MKLQEGIKQFWVISHHYRFRISVNALMGIIHVGISLSFVWISKLLIDAATEHTDDHFIILSAALVSCLIVELLLSAMRNRMADRMDIKLQNDLRFALFNHLMNGEWQGKREKQTGDLLNRLEEDVQSVSNLLCQEIPYTIVTIVQLISAVILLSILDMRLAVIILFIMPFALLLSKSFVLKMRALSHEIRESDSKVQNHLQEFLQHKILIKTLEYTKYAIVRLGKLQDIFENKMVERIDFTVFSKTMVQIGFSAGYVTAFLWGVCGLRDESITFGMMTAFLQLVSQIQGPMVDITSQIPSYIQTYTSLERLLELSGLPVESTEKSRQMSGKLGVRLERICFVYPNSTQKIFNDFSYTFLPGNMTAVVGETGIGKSTLVSLMLALFFPTKGTIRLFNTEEDVPISPTTRCNFSYVPQGNSLMSGTIRSNLQMGNPTANEEEIKSAIHAAAADFVYELPNGLDTHCGELGAGLSEGQAQRIAIARGLLRPGQIIIMDEPSSSLDVETEKLLIKRMALFAKNKTLIVITHHEKVANLCPSVLRIK